MEFTGERFIPQVDGDIKYEHLHRYALALDFVEGRTVLDIASGEGYGSALLAKRAAVVIGVDIDPESVNHAQHQYHDRANLKFLTGSCAAIPIADASIDVVVSFETIEHHDQHEEMMQEIKRVLKPDGVLIISSPNRLVYSDEPQYSNPFHVKELYYEELIDLLQRYFQQVELYGQRNAVSSWVTALESSHQPKIKAYSGDVTDLCDRVESLHSPIYFIAICSNRTEPLESVESTYLDVADDLWRQLQAAQHVDRLGLLQSHQEKEHLLHEKEQLLHEREQLLHEKEQLFHEKEQLFHEKEHLLHEKEQLLHEKEQLLHEKEQLFQALSQAHQQLQEFDRLQQDYDALRHQSQVAHELIKAMESSKFWKLRRVWTQVKSSLLSGKH